jgi:hypothetical protein
LLRKARDSLRRADLDHSPQCHSCLSEPLYPHQPKHCTQGNSAHRTLVTSLSLVSRHHGPSCQQLTICGGCNHSGSSRMRFRAVPAAATYRPTP